MYLRLAFWTLSMAYTSALFSRGTSGASPGHHAFRGCARRDTRL